MKGLMYKRWAAVTAGVAGGAAEASAPGPAVRLRLGLLAALKGPLYHRFVPSLKHPHVPEV